jgi:EAL and modified HD-GYP domain-containing signal transduction protein
MKLFIVSLPLFTSEMVVDSYRLVFRSSTKLFGTAQGHMELDGAMYSPGLDTLNRVGIDPFTGGKPIFIAVSQYLLLAGVAQGCNIPPEQVVCVLSTVPLDPEYLDKCRELKEQGFRIALEGIAHNRESVPLYKMADYIIVDAANKDFVSELRMLRIQYPAINALVMNVAEKTQFEKIKSVPKALFSGGFYTQPLTKGSAKVEALKANAIALLKTVSDEDYDLSGVSKVVGQDLALSVSLLKFINSPAVGITAKVNSIKAAIALLGQRETRKWVTAAVSLYIAQDQPNEIIRLSLVRAKFAENLATTFELGIHAQSLFMMGLFSLLDVVLEKPMEFAVEAVYINDNIKNALVSREGQFAPVLNLMYSYEQADWREVSYIIVINNIKIDNVYKAFEDALIWYKDVLEYIS